MSWQQSGFSERQTFSPSQFAGLTRWSTAFIHIVSVSRESQISDCFELPFSFLISHDRESQITVCLEPPFSFLIAGNYRYWGLFGTTFSFLISHSRESQIRFVWNFPSPFSFLIAGNHLYWGLYGTTILFSYIRESQVRGCLEPCFSFYISHSRKSQIRVCLEPPFSFLISLSESFLNPFPPKSYGYCYKFNDICHTVRCFSMLITITLA